MPKPPPPPRVWREGEMPITVVESGYKPAPLDPNTRHLGDELFQRMHSTPESRALPTHDESRKTQRTQARQRIKSLPKAAQEQIRKSLSRGLGSGNANTGAIVWNNLRRLLFATGKKALPLGTAFALWELAGRPTGGPIKRSRERDRSSEAGGYVEERLRQLVSPAPW